MKTHPFENKRLWAVVYSLFLSLFAVLFMCCSLGSREKADSYELEKSEKRLVFPLDANTKSFILALFPYTDKSGTEYLTFQNAGQNEILFYDMNTCRLNFKLKPKMEGPEGVGRFIGYYVHTLDSIFLTNYSNPEIVMVDRNAIIKDKINFEKATGGIPLTGANFTSSTYKPAQMIGRRMYIVTYCNRWIAEDPVSSYIDLDTKEACALPFLYPSFPGADNKAKRAGVEESMSRCYDGKQFVYSFHFDEDIYVAAPGNHQEMKRMKVKSNYVDNVKYLDDYGNLTIEDMCANPNYGNMLYDEYREVYYRIAYPETEIEKNINGMNLYQYGRKNFTIIILDKELNTIGETLFPDYTYNSKLMFIREDGLYISDSHCYNADYSDDVLGFRRFDLKKK